VGSHIIVSVEKITTYRRVFTTIEAEGNFFKLVEGESAVDDVQRMLKLCLQTLIATVQHLTTDLHRPNSPGNPSLSLSLSLTHTHTQVTHAAYRTTSTAKSLFPLGGYDHS
jgi:hypothetical protein